MYAGREAPETVRVKATSASQPTRATRSQGPVKHVGASLGDFVSVLAALCADADGRFIGVLRVRSSRAYRDQLTFNFHYTRNYPRVHILRLGSPIGSER